MNSNDYVSTVSGLSVPMSKFDVTRPSNFHKVLKTSVFAIYASSIAQLQGNLINGTNRLFFQCKQFLK